MAASLTKQTITLTLANAYTRGLGFLLRLALARIMGAEALGMMELTSSVSMLALTPVTAGTPIAVSRMTARHPSCDQRQVLLAGRSLVLRMAAVLAPALAMLAPLLAHLLGDTRTLPGLWCTVPAIPLMGLCSVYCGWYYGREDTRRPALSEATEQTVRCVLALGLLMAFPGASLGIRAAIPPAAESAAALCAVLMMRYASGLTRMRQEPSPTLRRELFRLCAPSVLARLCVTAARALNAVVLPVCLRASGLSTQAATAQFGLLNGMAMPLFMMPSVFTGALGMVASPAVAMREENACQLRKTVRHVLLWAGAAGMACAAVLFVGAPWIGAWLYHQAALAALLRIMAPMTVCFALHQVICGMLAGLGMQRRALTGTILSSCVTLVLTAWWAAIPRLRLYGAALAMMAGQFVNLCWGLTLLLRRVREKEEKLQC